MSISSSWQPIVTSPKNGVAILVFNGNTIEKAKFLQHYCAWVVFECEDSFYTVVMDGKTEEYSLAEPTHWMPLPNPPQG